MSNQSNKKKPATKVVKEIKEETINLDEIKSETIMTQFDYENYVPKEKVLEIISNARKQCYKSATLSRTQTLSILDSVARDINALTK